MLLRRIGLVFLLVLTGGYTLIAQEADCSEFTDPYDYANRGETALEQRLFDDAVLDFTCAIQLDPNDPNHYNGRGRAYYWLQQDQAANADFSYVLELDPEAGYAYNNLANLYAGIGDYEQALEYYTTALTLPSGTDEIVYTNRASIYKDMGDYASAQSDIELAFAINPSYAEAFLSQAGLHSLQNNVEGAAINYQAWLEHTQSTETNPQYVPNRSYVTRLLTGAVEKVSLSFNEGDVISISAAAIDGDQRVDPLIVLVGTGHAGVISDDDSGVNLDAVIADYVVPTSGQYVLWIGNAGGYYNEGVDGEIRVSIERKASDGALTVEVEPTPSGDNTAVATAEPSEEVVTSFSTFRLFAGAVSEVYTTEGDRLNLRSGPGLRFDILGKLDKGALVTLLEGPHKQDGLAWWRVRTADGTEGWAVERVDTEQTLQMALVAGEDALVTGGEGALNVRSGAGRANDIVFQLENDQRLTLLEKWPELVDGYQWWKIRLPDGREGWTIDRLEGERMLIPAKERDSQQ